MKITSFTFQKKKAKSRWYPEQPVTDADYAFDLAFLENALDQAESELCSLEQSARGIGLCVNSNER